MKTTKEVWGMMYECVERAWEVGQLEMMYSKVGRSIGGR